jgi:hypothetical protein
VRFSLIVWPVAKRLIKAPTAIDIPMIMRTALLLTMPRDISKIEKKAPTAPLANPITINLAGWRSCLSGEKVASANAAMDGPKKKRDQRDRLRIPS